MSSSPAPGHRTITVSPDPLPPGIGLSFIQQRFDEGTRRAQIRVLNGTGRPLPVTTVGLDWAGYPDGLQPERYDVPGGLVVNLRYLLPRADCSSTAGRAPMRAVVTTLDGRRIERPLPADGVRFLERIWRSECDARLLHRTVELDWQVEPGPASSERGRHLSARKQIHLVLRRRSGQAPVRVTQLQGSVLFELTPPRSGSLDARAGRARLPVVVAPGRCDEHGRSQSTQTWGWRAWVAVGRAEPRAVLVPPSPREQAALLGFLDRACGALTTH